MSFHIWSRLSKSMCKKCIYVQENLHWLRARSWGRFVSEVLLLIEYVEERPWDDSVYWSLLVTNVNDYLFSNILVSLGKKLVCVHVWVHTLPWLSSESECLGLLFFPSHLRFLSLFIFKAWTWCVWTQWTVGGGLVWFLHNHLKWLTQSGYTGHLFIKKYICLINTNKPARYGCHGYHSPVPWHLCSHDSSRTGLQALLSGCPLSLG